MTTEKINKLLRKIKYPKFILLALTFLVAYLILGSSSLDPLRETISSLGYLGTFIAGILFAYGFTAAPATAILLILADEQSIYLSAVIAGLGALAGDLIIFNLVKESFADEIERLSKEKILTFLHLKTPSIIKKYFLPVFAGFIIASPLPDEIGVSLLAASGRIPAKTFSILSYLLNTAGIFIILLIGKSV